MEFKHYSVLLNEVLSGLNISPDGVYLDCTLGGAGHSQQILNRLSKKGRLYAVDKDDDALSFSKDKLKNFNNVTFIKSDYKELEGKIDDVKFDGILLDLGVSSYQIDTAERGFSFLKEGPLDMRMDTQQEFSAYNVVNEYSQKELEHIFYVYGEESYGRVIAKNIIEKRKEKPIETTTELNQIIENAVPFKYKLKGAAKKSFQAIRIEVNNELECLDKTIEFLVSKLNKKGRIAIITFHSLEDRVVKQTFAMLEKDCVCPPKTPICICGKQQVVRHINKKPILPTQQELNENNRSRSAKLRVCEKI